MYNHYVVLCDMIAPVSAVENSLIYWTSERAFLFGPVTFIHF